MGVSQFESERDHFSFSKTALNFLSIGAYIMYNMARVLIVEDDPISRELLANIILKYSKEYYDSQWKLRITKVSSAIEALEAMNEYDFELVITDVLMAKMNGFEFVKEVRSRKPNSDLPIVVVSAIDGIELEYQCKRVGASLWFTKPVHPKEFSKKVFNLILER